MRSRFSAFALGLGDYLVDTLTAEHPDHAASREHLARELSRMRERRRFLGLTILYTTPPSVAAAERQGEVLFHARIFERGADRSFAELSTFVREPGGWRYASGIAMESGRLPPAHEIGRLTRERFLELVASVGATR
jgi:SEC-C motif-containing protein